MTGQDLVRQLQGKDLGDRLLITQNMLRRQEMDFLDDVTLRQAQEALGVPIVPTESDGFELWDAMCGLTPGPHPQEEYRETEEEYYRYN